nr:MAG: glycoprotein [Anopheles phasivirus 1]
MFIYLGLWSLLYSVTVQQQVSFTITDLEALERSLRVNGVSEPLFQAIYSAASCNLKANQIINKQLDHLVSTVDRLQQQSVNILHKLLDGKPAQSVDAGTAELIIKHVFEAETQTEQSNPNNEVEVLTSRNVLESSGTRYHPFSAIEKVVAPDICKTLSVTQDLLNQLDTRKEQLLELAKKHYGYDGNISLSKFAVFYHNYVVRNFADRSRVMGLAKILGDYITISSEAFYMSEALENNARHCESHLRKQRNVDVKLVLKGTCNRYYNRTEENNSKILKNVPFAKSIRNFLTERSCPHETRYLFMADEKEAYEIMMMGFISVTSACVYSSSCANNKQFLSKDGTCRNHNGTISLTNVKDLEVSVVRDRMLINEIPEDLKSLANTYCSIDSTIISKEKDCERPIMYIHTFIAFQIETKWFITDKSVTIAHGQDVTNLCFYDCSNCINCVTCKGDVTYESAFGTWPKSNCTCKYNKEYSDLYISIGAARIAVNAVARVEWEVTVPVKSSKMIVCSSCKATCTGTTVKIERDVEFDKLHACVNDQCFIIESNQVDVEYELPSNLFHVSHLEIRFYRSDGAGAHTIPITCKDQHQCESLTCDFCLIRFSNPHCYKFINWLFFVGLASGVILCIPVSYFAMSMLWLIIKMALFPFMLMWKMCKICSKRAFKSTKSKANNIKRKVDEYCEIELDEVKPAKIRDPLRDFSLTAIIFLMILTPALSCENSAGVSTNQTNCETNQNGQVKCKISTIVDLALSSLGEDSCLSLKDQNNILVEVIKIRTLGIKQVCLKDVQYYTIDPNFKFINLFRCRSAGTCVDDICEKASDKSWTTLPYEDETKAGIKGCLRVTGFWGKGCFYAGQACNFYKAELTNHNKVTYEVSKCTEWVWEVTVEISIKKGDEEMKQERKLSTSIPSTSDIGILQLETIRAPTVPALGRCLVKKLTAEPRSALVDCTDRGTRSPGIVGEIQCSTPMLAEQASKACLLSSLSHTVIPQDDNLVFINKFVNVSNLWESNVLPRTIGDSVISEVKSGDVMLHYSGSASYNIRIKMSNYQVSFDYSKATCEAHFRSLKGCSNCGSGALIILEVILKGADRVPISLTCPSSSSDGLDLAVISNTLREFKMKFNKAEIKETCILTCPGNTVDVNVKGTLLNSINVGQSSDNLVIGWASDFIASVPWLNFGFLRYVYIGLGVLIVVPIILLLLKAISLFINLIVSLVPKRNNHKLQSKYI